MGHSKGVLTLYNLSQKSQGYLRHISGKSQAYLRHISDQSQAYLRPISDISQTNMMEAYLRYIQAYHVHIKGKIHGNPKQIS